MAEQVPVSTRWVVVSFVVYLLCEVALGGVLAPLLSGFVSRPMAMRVEVLLMLGSFFLGGFLIGVFSPTVRVIEPALGAAAAVLLTFVYALFMPMSYYRFATDRLLMGALVAFGIAMAGADAGERVAGRLGNRASREYGGGA